MGIKLFNVVEFISVDVRSLMISENVYGMLYLGSWIYSWNRFVMGILKKIKRMKGIFMIYWNCLVGLKTMDFGLLVAF